MDRLFFPITSEKPREQPDRTTELAKLVNPQGLLAISERTFPWDEALERFKPVFDELKIDTRERRRLFLGLGILTTEGTIDPKFTCGLMVQNIYWQHFCGLKELCWRFPKGPGDFETFYQKAKERGLWAEYEKNTPEAEPANPVELSRLVDPQHQLAILERAFPWAAALKTCAPIFAEMGITSAERQRLFVGLGVLCTDGKIEPEFGAGLFEQNFYWQQFCGLKQLCWRFPDDNGDFQVFYLRAKQRGHWERFSFDPPQGPAEPNRLAEVINPKNYLVIAERAFRWKDALGIFEPLCAAYKITSPERKRLFVGMGVLIHNSPIPAEFAEGLLIQNLYWQYFCGLKEQIWRFPEGPGEFEPFYLKAQVLKLWDEVATQLSPDRPKKSDLSKLTDPRHFLTTAERILPWDEALEIFAPLFKELKITSPERRRLFLGLGLLTWEGPIDPSFSCGLMLQNVYWQAFCGLSEVIWEFPTGPGNFEEFYALARERGYWQKVGPLAKKYFKRSYHYVHDKSGATGPIYELLSNWEEEIPTQKFPIDLPMEAPGAGQEFWSKAVEFFWRRQWKTAWVSAAHPDTNEENLFLKCIPAGDQGAVESVMSGQQLIDVVILESPDRSSGKIRFHTRGADEPFQRLDFVLNRAQSMDEFLARPDLQEDYFEVLRLYYGIGRFPRESYEKILNQLRAMVWAVPDLRDRLWAPTPHGGEPFSIDIDLPSFGTEVSIPQFHQYLRTYLVTLAGGAEQLSPKRIREVLQVSVDKIRKFESTLPPGGSPDRTSEFYKSLKSDPMVERVARGLVVSYLAESPKATSIFETKDPDVILAFFQNLRQHPAQILQDQNYSVESGFWASYIREQLPTMDELLKQEEVFPPITRTTRRGSTVEQARFQRATYTFRPISRKIHGIWRGIYWKDCAGGDPRQLEETMPERWASVALEGTQLYLVERWGRFQGTAQLIPFSYAGKKYGSVETQWPQFFTRADASTLIFEKFLQRAKKYLPKDWQGLVVGHTPAGRPPSEQEILKKLDCYQEGEVIGIPADVSFPDPLAAKIVEAGTKLSFGRKYRKEYGNQILTDVSFKSPGPLLQLNLDAVPSE